jgi:uncharacterized membrane protein
MPTPTAIKYIKLVTKYLFAAFYIFAGVRHFVRPEFYLKIMPDYLPWHKELVFLSGVAEVLLGVLLAVPRTSRLAGWGLIALLIAIFPANIYLYQHQEILPAPPWVHLLRLPLQVVLILFAYWYTRPDGPIEMDDRSA